MLSLLFLIDTIISIYIWCLIASAILSWLVAFNVVKGTVPPPTVLVVGGGALVATAVMAATSNDAAVRALGGARWRGLHGFGMWWLWLVFTFTYGGRLGREPDFFAVFALACVAALVLRIAGRRRTAATALADAA